VMLDERLPPLPTALSCVWALTPVDPDDPPVNGKIIKLPNILILA